VSEAAHALDAARRELGVRDAFPPQVLAEAEAAAGRTAEPGPGRADRRDLPLVTIDPPGSRDLDQALALEEDGDGLRLWYAIADVGFFVDRGGAVEAEAWLRGVTYYAPDGKRPLYPEVLSQGPASLLPDVDRPCILFDLRLDAAGELRSVHVAPAMVRSRAQLTYTGVVERMQEGRPREGEAEWYGWLPLLRRFGELRTEVEARRGGVSLPLVRQHVTALSARRLGLEVSFEEPMPSEEWNEQVSLLTGHAAALRMLEADVGMLRTLDPPDPKALAAIRRAARALGFRWDDGVEYADFIRGLDLANPCVTPLVWQARRVMRGAGYDAFHGAPPADPLHHALAMPYAHVTAPLRRLADRYVLDLLVELEAGRAPSAAELETLRALPSVMAESNRRQSRLEGRAVDVAEAWMLRERVGEVFSATVLDAAGRYVEVQIEEPAVRARASVAGAAPEAGEAVRVRLEAVDVDGGAVEFAVAA
jgi:exoribonuclease R